MRKINMLFTLFLTTLVFRAEGHLWEKSPVGTIPTFTDPRLTAPKVGGMALAMPDYTEEPVNIRLSQAEDSSSGTYKNPLSLNGNEGARSKINSSMTENVTDQNPFLLKNRDILEERDLSESENVKETSASLSASMANAIARMTSAIISLLASIAMLTMILRSHDGLSTPLHRLLFGLCVSDIISSFASSLSTSMAFSETKYYIWNASGNVTSCDTQGFLLAFGSSSGILYNCCMCLYYKAVVRNERSDQYIKARLEPFYHGASIVIPLIISVTTLACEAFNPAPNDGICWAFEYNPPHCEGYEDGEIPDGYSIPCGRGQAAMLLSLIFSFPLLLASPIVIIVTMTITYKAVVKEEKKMARYGIGSLRASVARASVVLNDAGEQRRLSVFRRLSTRLSNTSSIVSQTSSKKTSRSRAVLYKGLAYSAAYMICYMPYFIANIIFIFIDSKKPFALILFFQICVPLQGLLNFAIFIHPKVVSAKSKGNVSLAVAFVRALKSRGSKRRRTSLDNNGRLRRRKNNTRRRQTSRWSKSLRKKGRSQSYHHRFSKNYAVDAVEVAGIHDNSLVEGQQYPVQNTTQPRKNSGELQRIYDEMALQSSQNAYD